MSYIDTSHLTDPEYFDRRTHGHRCPHCPFAFRDQADLDEHCSTTHQFPGLEIRVIIRKHPINGLYVSEVRQQIKPIDIFQ